LGERPREGELGGCAATLGGEALHHRRELEVLTEVRASSRPVSTTPVLEALERNGARLTVASGTDSVAAIATTLPLVPTAISISTPRSATSPDLAWRPIEGGPLHATIVAVWRSRPRQPALRALVGGLRRSLADGPWQPPGEPRRD
jgi:hypothetical protein